ncbi:MAG: alpha/beta family hydrolase [Vicinamibacterales bacterium]
MTFDFPYMADGRRAVDSNAVLESAWCDMVAEVAATAPDSARRLIVGGKSMGGRIASQVAARPELLAVPLAGLVYLGYPLHPPGKIRQR